MKIQELHQLLEQHPATEIQIQSHHEGVYFTVEIAHGDDRRCLHSQKDKPLVFRDEESARNLLQQAGIDQVRSRRILSRFTTLAQPAMNMSWNARFA